MRRGDVRSVKNRGRRSNTNTNAMAEPRASTSSAEGTQAMQPATTSTGVRAQKESDTPAAAAAGGSTQEEVDGWRIFEHPQIANADEILGILLSNVADTQGRSLLDFLQVSAGRAPRFTQTMSMLTHGNKGTAEFYNMLEDTFKDALRIAEAAANDEEAFDFQEDALELAADAEDAEDEAEELTKRAVRKRRRAQKWDAEHGNRGSAEALLNEEETAAAEAAAEASTYALRVFAAEGSDDEDGAEFEDFEHVGFYAVVLQILYSESFMAVYNVANTNEARRNHVVQALFDRGVYGPCLLFRRARREGSTHEYDILGCDRDTFLTEFSDELMDISETSGFASECWRDFVFDIMTTQLGRRLRRWWTQLSLKMAWGEGDDDDQRHTR